MSPLPEVASPASGASALASQSPARRRRSLSLGTPRVARSGPGGEDECAAVRRRGRCCFLGCSCAHGKRLTRAQGGEASPSDGSVEAAALGVVGPWP